MNPTVKLDICGFGFCFAHLRRRTLWTCPPPPGVRHLKLHRWRKGLVSLNTNKTSCFPPVHSPCASSALAPSCDWPTNSLPASNNQHRRSDAPIKRKIRDELVDGALARAPSRGGSTVARFSTGDSKRETPLEYTGAPPRPECFSGKGIFVQLVLVRGR